MNEQPLSFLARLNALGLDTVLLALSWQGLLAELWQVSLTWHEHLLLGGIVWLMYLFDRLTEPSEARQHSPRHQFLYQYRFRLIVLSISLLLLMVLTLYSAVAVSSHWNQAILHTGLSLFAVVVIYTLLVNWTLTRPYARLGRELVVAAVFTTGVSFFPYGLSMGQQAPVQFAELFLLFAMFSANALGISVCEGPSDAQSGQVTLVTTFSGLAKRFHWVLGSLLVLMLFIGFRIAQLPVLMTFCITSSVLSLLVWRFLPRNAQAQLPLWMDTIYAIIALIGLGYLISFPLLLKAVT